MKVGVSDGIGICAGTNRGDCRLRRWQENNKLDHARVKLPTGSKFHFPTFKVTVVPLVARVPDPQVVAAESRLMLNPGEDVIIFLFHTFVAFMTLAIIWYLCVIFVMVW